MNKYFLIILALTSFFSATAQDSTVCISKSAALYYLEADDERWVLREKDSISNELIFVQSEQLLVKDQIIQTYQADSVYYQDREAIYIQHIDLMRSELDRSGREVKKQRGLKFIAIVLGILGTVLL